MGERLQQNRSGGVGGHIEKREICKPQNDSSWQSSKPIRVTWIIGRNGIQEHFNMARKGGPGNGEK